MTLAPFAPLDPAVYREAVRRVKDADAELPVRVEVSGLDGVDEALATDADIIAVGHLLIPEATEAVSRTRGRAKLELIGTRNRVAVGALASSGAEYVLVDALTAAALPIELVFELER